ncbi:MAG: DinB family protein [Anaerolineales bacterium]|nr:DinB family protein [Anaerolineales bacterium]
MLTITGYTTNLERNAAYLREHTTGLTHAHSLVQPPVEGNCINWILGHILCYRNYLHTLCGLPEAAPTAAANRYARGSAPVTTDGPEVLRFEELLAAYEGSQAAVLAALPTLSADDLAEVVSAAGFTMPRGDLMTMFMRHESYHLGQFEWLRVWALNHG